MHIIIDIDNPNPLFAQLVDQIKKTVDNEKFQAGAALPSIRQLANDLEINSKTVTKAYKLLERDNVIQSRGYQGTFVHPDAKANSAVDLGKWATEKFTKTIDSLRQAGVTDSEIRIAFSNIMKNK